MNLDAFYLTGPTGSGKSAVALELAELVNGEIVNADAFQLYDGLRVLTARPSEEDQARVPHHLYGRIPPTDSIDANAYAERARLVIKEIEEGRGKIPLIVGGSGLYIKALTHGMNEVPRANPQLRQQLAELDEASLREALRLLDPASEASITAGNLRYLRRALEICHASGRPASEVRQSWQLHPPGLRGVLLDRPRSDLFHRINTRVEAMFRDGAVEEVRKIPEWSETALKAIGVREIQAHLAGEISEIECLTRIQLASRHYAKRQLTWFRRESWLTLQPVDPEMTPRQLAEGIAERHFT